MIGSAHNPNYLFLELSPPGLYGMNTAKPCDKQYAFHTKSVLPSDLCQRQELANNKKTYLLPDGVPVLLRRPVGVAVPDLLSPLLLGLVSLSTSACRLVISVSKS